MCLYCPFKREFIIVSGNYFNYKDYIFFTFKFILHNSLLYIRVSHYLHILYVPEIFGQIKLCTFGSCTYKCATETLHSTQTEGRGTSCLTGCESYRTHTRGHASQHAEFMLYVIQEAQHRHNTAT